MARRILGKSEGAYVLVSFDRTVTPATVDSLMAMARSEPIPGLASPKMILVVPQNTDVTGISREVTVLPMQNFSWEEKEPNLAEEKEPDEREDLRCKEFLNRHVSHTTTDPPYSLFEMFAVGTKPVETSCSSCTRKN